jgi:hypothetical protein
MRKIVALIPFVSYLSMAGAVFAADQGQLQTCDPTSQFNVLCNLTAGNFGSVVGSVISLMFVVAVVAALFYLVYGGFRWLISTGDKTKVSEAREHIIAAIIGLVVIFLSYFILNLILGFFGLGNLSSLKVPAINLH